MDVPVDEVLVEAFLSECSGPGLSNFLSVGVIFNRVEGEPILESSSQILQQSHSSLVVETLVSHWIYFSSQELQVSTDLLCSFAGILDLKARKPEAEIVTESEMSCEEPKDKVLAQKEKDLASVPVWLKPHLCKSLVQVALVLFHLLLGVNVFKKLCLLPPSINN